MNSLQIHVRPGGRVAAFLLLLATAGSALAQWQPTKPVRFYMPFAPGGAAEAILRTVTDPLKDRLKQPVIIEAKPGGGQLIAADLVAKLGAKAEVARELAYRLYTLCERKKRAAEALSYNALVQSWPEIMRLAQETPRDQLQGTLL